MTVQEKSPIFWQNRGVRPLDPRLMKYARSARRHIFAISLLGGLTAVLVIAQIFAISAAIAPIITGEATPSQVWIWVAATSVIALLRALVTAAREALGHKAAEQAICELRSAVLDAADTLGPRWRAQHGAETATLLTRGLDNLAPYFVKFLPQLILTMTVTPLALATITYVDFWSALIALIVVPLIPIFMILIGRFTQDATHVKLRAMERLGAQLLDLMSGLPTLRALGREQSPRHHIKELGEANTNATMATLRIAFLSGGALEFLATLSVALVAVEVGMRLVFSHMSLFYGLVVIMLAPEVFEPLRQVGAQFHASADGVAAANAAFDVIEAAEKKKPRVSSDIELPAAEQTVIVCRNLSVAARGAWAPYRLDAQIRPGTITVLAGDSGAGKTTTVQNILGIEPPTEGGVFLRCVTPDAHSAHHDALAGTEVDLHEALQDPRLRRQWWDQITWIPQHPTIISGTLLDNLPTGASSEELSWAAEITGFDSVLTTLSDGWNTVVGSRGVGLSVGQRQRLALMGAFLAPSSIVILDEPTAHLDAVSEETIVSAVEHLHQRGKTVIVIAHRQAIHSIAHHVIAITRHQATAEEIERYPILAPQDTLESLHVALPEFLDEALIDEAHPTNSLDASQSQVSAGEHTHEKSESSLFEGDQQ